MQLHPNQEATMNANTLNNGWIRRLLDKTKALAAKKSTELDCLTATEADAILFVRSRYKPGVGFQVPACTIAVLHSAAKKLGV
jgi:hypothetical protein